MKKNKKSKKDREVAVIDFETDPFKFDRVPAPFAVGVLWAGIYVEFWGRECWKQAADYLLSIETPLIVYAHNGGKFDFFFMWPVLDNPVKLINGRIVAATLGIHELRDSWSIMPFALARYKKTEIDYAKFEPEVRLSHRTEILDYQHDDCNDLMDLCSAFVKRFGFRLTIAGTAMKALDAIHPQEPTNENHDSKFRPFYYGGRVECFEAGVLKPGRGRKFRVYDVNSMYPAVMSNADHPIGNQYVQPELLELDQDGWFVGYPGAMYFCEVEGINKGALPMREIGGDGGLRFDAREGIFSTTSHELRAALDLGLFSVRRICRAFIPCYVQRFDEFVSTYAEEKAVSKKAGDKIGEIFAKLIMNSAYGKFGQDPADFCDYQIVVHGVHQHPAEDSKWSVNASAEKWTIYESPSPRKLYFDVAIAASVTSAARAVLMRAIANAKRPIYCDTDSIICEALEGVPMDEYTLGAWKLEAQGTRAAIAGKKLYALFDGDRAVKSASKGVKLSPIEIEKVAGGASVLWQSQAPNFSLSGKTKFIARTAKRTA